MSKKVEAPVEHNTSHKVEAIPKDTPPKEIAQNIKDDTEKPTPPNKIQARAAKFDDLFGDSDEDDGDMFSSKPTKPPQNTDNLQSAVSFPETTPFPTPDPEPLKQKTENIIDASVDKIKTRAAKFDDLFGDSDEDDIFSTQDTVKPVETNGNIAVTDDKAESPNKVSSDLDLGSSSQEAKMAPKSNIAKLQNNLNFNPAMLMGGPRPKKQNEAVNVEDAEKTEDVNVNEIPDNKLKAKAAKFDDLFGDSDEEDIFSTQEKELPKSTEKPNGTDLVAQLAPKLNYEKTKDTDNVKSPAKEVKARAAKFDDLFGESDDEAGDIFSSREKPSSQSVLSDEQIPRAEPQTDPSTEVDSGPSTPKTKAAPNSNIAKLQNNLKFNPAMLMGGARPPVSKQTEKSAPSER